MTLEYTCFMKYSYIDVHVVAIQLSVELFKWLLIYEISVSNHILPFCLLQ